MSKSIKQWFIEDLSPELSEKALFGLEHAQLTSGNKELIYMLENFQSNSLANALKQGFIWEATPEGHDFWNSVHLKAAHNGDKDSWASYML